MIQPPFLKPGDIVGIVSTARKISHKEIFPAINLLESWGLKFKTGKSIGLEADQFAGTDEARAADLQNMINDPDVKAIWCARGGYGTVRIIDKLDFSGFLEKPKWIIGYSDVTVLHSQLHIMGIQSLHSEMAHQIQNKSEATRDSLKNVLFGKLPNYEIPSSEKNRFGIAEGKLTGGNLSVLYSLLGSPSAISTKGKILFLEDLDEYLYHIDRMMQNLKRNGMFDHINGLIVGGMSKMRDNTTEFGFGTDNPYGKTAVEIIQKTVGEYDFPVVFDFPAGHLNDNRALVFGKRIILDVRLETTEIIFP